MVLPSEVKVGTAQSAVSVSQVEAHDFVSFNDWLAEWKAGHANIEQGVALARERKSQVQRLIKENPVQAYELAISREEWNRLPEKLKAEVEHRFSGDGTYAVRQDCESGLTMRQLTMEDFSTGQAVVAPALAERSEFTGVMRGVVLGNFAAVVAMEGGTVPVQTGTTAPAVLAAAVTGTYKVLWLNIKFSDETSYPTVGTSLSDAATSYSAYSYGRLTLIYDVVNVDIAATKASNPSDSTIMSQAQAAAQNSGYPSTNYAAVIYRQSLYGQYAGLYNYVGYVMLSKSARDTNVHEIAHTMGVHHANLWKPDTGQPSWGTGVNTLYGETWDAMGFSSPRDDFNVPEKIQLGWLDQNTDYVHDVGNGTYRLYDHRSNSRSAFSSTGVTGAYFAVSVFKDTKAANGEAGDRRYLLSYRDRTNVGATTMTEGLCLHWPQWTYNGSGGYNTNAPYGSDIIDTHTAANGVNDAPLSIGETYVDNDPNNRDGPIYITALRKTDPDGILQSGDEYVDVKVVVGTQTGNSAPTGTLTFAQSTVAPGESAVMSVTASDPNGDTLAYLWDFGLGTTVAARNQMPLNGASSQQFTYTAQGTYTVKVTISDCRGGATQLTKTITVANSPPTVNAGADQAITTNTGLWTPAALAPLAWYDAADSATITAASGKVAQWSDKTGKGNNLIQATSAAQPTTGTSTINGVNAIAFDGVANILNTSSNPFGATINNAMVMLVMNIGTIANGTMFTLSGSGTAANRWQAISPFGNGSIIFDCGGTSAPNRISGASGWTANQNKLVDFYGSTTDNVQQVWVNGSLFLSDATGHAVSTVSGFSFGGLGTSYDNCSLGEVVILNSTVSASNRQKMEGYLAHKWGMAADLPSDHPSKSAPPVATVANLHGVASDPDPQAPTTTWSFVSGPAAVNFTNASAADTTAFFTATGTYVLRLTANDGVNVVSDDVTITVADPVPPTIYETWATGPFSGTLADTTTSGDPDGDGVSTLLEFALGTDPTLRDARSLSADGTVNGMPVCQVAVSGGGLEFLFVRRKDFGAQGSLDYTAQFSADLVTFYDSTDVPVFVANSSARSDYEIVKVSFPALLPNSKPASFGRVKVVLHP